MPVPFAGDVFPVDGAEGSDGGRRTPPLACGTPPLDASAPAFVPMGAADTFRIDAAPFFPNEMQARMAAAKAKKAIEAAAQEHPGWSAVTSQIDDPRRAKMDRKARPAVSAGMEKQRALVAACVKARSRPLTHTAPPQNLAEMHRRIMEGQAASEKKNDELTPRFPPANVFLPAGEEPSSGPAAASDLPRILGRSAQVLSMSPKAEDALGLDLKFLDEDEETPADGGLLADPFLSFAAALPESPAMPPPPMPAAMPPMPSFLFNKA